MKSSPHRQIWNIVNGAMLMMEVPEAPQSFRHELLTAFHDQHSANQHGRQPSQLLCLHMNRTCCQAAEQTRGRPKDPGFLSSLSSTCSISALTGAAMRRAASADWVVSLGCK